MCNIHIITENKKGEISVFGGTSFDLKPHKKCLKFSMRKLVVIAVKSFISVTAPYNNWQKDLKKSPKNYELEKWFSKEFDFKEFMKGLACTHKMPQCLGCQKGGEPPTCKVRICALGKGMVDCS